jgi:hypothetical protein
MGVVAFCFFDPRRALRAGVCAAARCLWRFGLAVTSYSAANPEYCARPGVQTNIHAIYIKIHFI